MDVANNPGNAAPDSAAGAAASGLRGDVAAQAIPAKSVAVLPFENLSTDKGNGYFADGMQDLILTKLADIGDLKVISRTSTMKYASHPDDLKIVGQQLGVATILEGSVQKAGNQVLINVQLIDAKTDNHLWAESYTRTLDNIFGVEGEVAQKVADALKAKLTQAESAKVTSVPTQNPAAFDDFLRGEHYLSMVKAGDFKMLPDTVDAYRRATQADPKFALAWARLAFAQSMLNYTSIDVSKATGRQALANAEQALALEPNLPQAHWALGYVYRFDLQDFGKALDEFRIAQEGLPNDADVEAAIAYIEDGRGDVQAAAARLERAVTLNPRSPNLAVSLGDEYMELHQYDRARVAYQRVPALAPDDPEGYSALARVTLLQHGDVNAALAELDKAPAALQSDPEIVYARVNLLVLKRDYTAARKTLAALRPGGRSVTPSRVALLRGGVNELSGHQADARKDYESALALARVADAQVSIVYAEIGLGNKQAALEAAQVARATAQRSGMSWMMNWVRYALSGAYAKFGDTAQAISELSALLQSPTSGWFSVQLLKLDPMWDPIRHDPRFQALLKKYGDATPASAAGAAAVAGRAQRGTPEPVLH
jgi:TolB-like protein/Flp pilus assembly protein TadD